MSKEFSQPAFPVPGLQHDEDFNGMTLRDYFAAKALAAMISYPEKEPENCGARGVPKIAAWAYQYADAMLAARSA